MNHEIASNTIAKILILQKLGAYLGLFYALISFVLGFLTLKSCYYYSVPLFIAFRANDMYKDYDRKFNGVKIQLKEIQEFEKE